MKQKFDGLAKKYDSWFMKNEYLFESEFLLFKKALGDINGKHVLSVGCGSGLFESNLENSSISFIEGIEPSEDMALIAEKRGMKVKCTSIEEAEIKKNIYDIIYFNGSPSYIEDLNYAYSKSYNSLKQNGKIIIFDVPKESAFGFMYLLAKSLDTFNHEFLNKAIPELPYPLELAKNGIWYTTEEQIQILKNIGFKNFKYYQTLIKNPIYTNEEAEEVIEGYKSGGYVAIIAEK